MANGQLGKSDSIDRVLTRITVKGSIVGTRNDRAEVLRLHAAARAQVTASGRKHHDVNACVDERSAARCRPDWWSR